MMGIMTARKPSSNGRKPAAAKKPATKSGAKKAAPKKRTVVLNHVSKGESGSKSGFTAKVRAEKQKQKPKTAPRKPNPNGYAETVKSLRAAYYQKHIIILEVPFEERAVARALGAVYIDRIGKYIYVGDLLPADLKPYRSEPYSYNRWLEDQINGVLRKDAAPSDGYYEPRDHQVEAINKISTNIKNGWRSFILADSTGLGKSLEGLLGLEEGAKARGFNFQNQAKVLILCPHGALPHWRNTIRHAKTPSLRIMLINYDQYKKLLVPPASAVKAKKQSTKNAHISEKGQPFIHWDFIISDEAQKLKNYTSQRTRAFERIAEYSAPHSKAPFVLVMTATLGQNPLELGYIAPLIGQAVKKPLTMETWPEWLKDEGFNVKKQGKTWQWIKPSSPNDTETLEKQRADVKRLSAMLFNPKAPSIRRKPEDLKGWPEQNIIRQPVQFSASSQKEYDRLWRGFREEMKLTLAGQKNPSSVLAQQLRFSQKSSFLRVPQTVEQIVENLELGNQVAVSYRFIESVEETKSALAKLGIEASEFSGRPFINKERERLRFQKGDTKVILFTVEEAVSFHANESLPDGSKASPFKRTTLIHDLRYSALSITQILGRAHRDGEQSNAYFLYADGTIEEKILNIMLNKMENLATLSGDEEDMIIEIAEAITV